MIRTRTFAVAVVTATLLGGGLGPGVAGTSPAIDGRPSRPLEWRPASDPLVLRPNTTTSDISCSPTSDSCVAVGYRYDDQGAEVPVAQRWDGSAWRAEALPAGGAATLSDVECSSAVDCVALAPRQDGDGTDRRIAVRTATGWRWVGYTVPDDTDFTNLSCSSPTSCVLTGTDREVATFDGTAVRAEPRTPLQVNSLSCPAADYCAATADTAFLEWDGANWSVSALDAVGQLRGVDCWARQECLAIAALDAEVIAFTRSATGGWRAASPPGSGARFVDDASWVGTPGVDCVDGACHLPLDFGSWRSPRLRVLSWTADAWQASRVLDPAGAVVAIACRTGECVLADVYHPDDDVGEPYNTSALHVRGSQWVHRAMVNPRGSPPAAGPHEATCPRRDWCLALGSYASDTDYVVRWHGARWRELPPAVEDQFDLDCWRVGACVVAGSDSEQHPRAAMLHGGRWQALPALTPAWMAWGTMSGVACTSGRCYYSGFYELRGDEHRMGVFVAWRAGRTWRVQRMGPTIANEYQFTGRPSMDCPTASRCVVVFSMQLDPKVTTPPTSFEAVLQGRHWRARTLGRGFSLFEVDCADADHCVAGGGERHPALVVTRDAGGRWSRVPFRARDAAFYSVSCTSTRECYVAGAGSPLVRLTRGTRGWRARAAGPRGMTDIACSGPRWCLTFNAERTWIGR